MEDSREIRTMRHMAWERAKGELEALLSTYWGHDGDYERMCAEVEKFIDKVQSEGYHE